MPPNVIVVPCYNERERLDLDAFTRFAQACPSFELKLVDDGSTDGTAQVLDRIAAANPGQINVLRLRPNQGKGAAVRAGLSESIQHGAEVVAYLDADLSTPLEELERLFSLRQSTEVDGVLGSRVALLGHNIRRSLMRHYLGRAFGTVAALVLRMQVYDTQCGAKVFKVSPALEHALAEPFTSRWAFDVELLARLHAADPDARLVEVPLREWSDVQGSRLSPRDMLVAAFDLLMLARQTRQKPNQPGNR